MRKPKTVSIDERIAWFGDVRAVLSPMAGVTDRAFRDICRDHGADLCFCEFTAAKGLTYENERTWQLIDTEWEDGRVGVQIFGNDPEAMAGAARMMRGKRLDVLDINYGCPAKKVVKKCGGSALLADVPLLTEIAREVVQACDRPVSAKIRTGWDADSVNYREVGLALQEAGCVWVTMHGRTRAQKFRGEADWDTIADLVETLDIPVIGNGDVVDAESWARLSEHTGCHAVMVGRGAIGNPWLFDRINALRNGTDFVPPTLEEIVDTAIRHIAEDCRLRGYRHGSFLVRKHLVRYFKGFPGASNIRKRLFATEDGSEMLTVAESLREELLAGELVEEGHHD